MPTVAVVTIPEENHFALLLPLIAGLATEGAAVHVLTHEQNAAAVERAGATFFDLYGRYPVAEADDESLPITSRLVTHAGHFAEEIVEDVAALDPEVLVHDVFAVAGRVAADGLGIPRVVVSPWHNLDPAPYIAELQEAGKVSPSARCLAAVDVLRDRYGIADASPFSFVSGLSDVLNVCLEPSAFVTPDERRLLEPVAFYGSLPHGGTRAALGREGGTSSFECEPGPTRVYVSFGTIVWRYFTPQALAALDALADALAERPNVQALISLGRAPITADQAATLERPNVSVTDWANQWEILREADVFVTHHGLASTHEAVFHRVPMLSMPFFGDQPGLAARCAELGVARPIVREPTGLPSSELLDVALDELVSDGGAWRDALDRAHGWETETLVGRGLVHRQLLELASVGAHART